MKLENLRRRVNPIYMSTNSGVATDISIHLLQSPSTSHPLTSHTQQTTTQCHPQLSPALCALILPRSTNSSPLHPPPVTPQHPVSSPLTPPLRANTPQLEMHLLEPVSRGSRPRDFRVRRRRLRLRRKLVGSRGCGIVQLG